MRKTRRLRKKRGVKTNSNKKYTKKNNYKQKRKRSYKRNSLKKQKKTRRKRTAAGVTSKEKMKMKNLHQNIREKKNFIVNSKKRLDILKDKNEMGYDALWMAINYGNEEAVNKILNAGVPPDEIHKDLAKIRQNTLQRNPRLGNISERETSERIYHMVNDDGDDRKWKDLNWPALSAY